MDKWRIYVREALTQLGFAKQCFAEFEAAHDAGDIPGIFFNLHHFIVHVANVDKLLDPKPGSDRAALFAGRIDLSGIDLKPFRRLRNHLEHFDERLDSWVKNYDGHAFFDMNLITGAKGFPSKAFLRALDGTYTNFMARTICSSHSARLWINFTDALWQLMNMPANKRLDTDLRTRSLRSLASAGQPLR